MKNYGQIPEVRAYYASNVVYVHPISCVFQVAMVAVAALKAWWSMVKP